MPGACLRCLYGTFDNSAVVCEWPFGQFVTAKLTLLHYISIVRHTNIKHNVVHVCVIEHDSVTYATRFGAQPQQSKYLQITLCNAIRTNIYIYIYVLHVVVQTDVMITWRRCFASTAKQTASQGHGINTCKKSTSKWTIRLQ